MATANPLGVLSQDLMWIINTITAPRLYFVRCSVTLQIRDISTFHLLGQSLANTFTERDIINTIYKSRSLYCFQSFIYATVFTLSRLVLFDFKYQSSRTILSCRQILMEQWKTLTVYQFLVNKIFPFCLLNYNITHRIVMINHQFSVS